MNLRLGQWKLCVNGGVGMFGWSVTSNRVQVQVSTFATDAVMG